MKKITGLLGLCSRCGQITLGADLALRQIKANRAGLVLMDAEASEGTKKKIADACAYRHVPLHLLPEGLLSLSCGKEDRMAGAIAPGPLCDQLRKLLNEAGNAPIQWENRDNNDKCGGASVQ